MLISGNFGHQRPLQ